MYDEVTLHVCPNHCGAHFDVTVHVTQDWEVDAEGNFEKALNEAVEVTHGPQDDDCWACSKCGAEAEAIQCVIMVHDIKVPESDGVAHTRLRTYVQRHVPLMDLPRAFVKDPETGGVYEASVVQNQNGSYTAKYGKYEFTF